MIYNQDDTLSRTTGSVVLQVGALELLARYSMNSGRATSMLSSLHEFRTNEAEQAGGKQWNWKYLRVASDIIYLIGVNVMGIYFRLMNEVITRRSFLDRRACVESTLRLKFVKDQEERLMLSILPEHIVSRVRQDIRNMFMNIRSQSNNYIMKSFRKVHITKQTLELLLDNARDYIIEPNFESQRDPFIMNNKLETYLISRPPRPMTDYKPFRRASVGLNKIINPRSRNRRSENRSSSNFRRSTAFMDENLVEYQQMLKAADAQMAKEIEDMTNGKEHFKKESRLNTFSLMYKNFKLEKSYLRLPDPLFKAEETKWYTWLSFSTLISFLAVMQPLTWFQFLWTKYKGVDEPRNAILRKLYDISHITQCWSLALLLNFLFSRVFFIFKWIVAACMTVFYLWIVWEVKTSFFSLDISWNIGLDSRISHTLSVVFVTITLYWIDRTTEYRNRLDHLWQIQLSEEQDEAETMLKVNNMLLENILPAHKYDNVAVMFASLTDYKLGLESDSDLSDKLILSILDEVISDFDRLLLTGASVYRVEKIKVAGWTYMAACGLDPSRKESFDSSSFNSLGDKRHNNPYNRAIVVTMMEFAAAMMVQLQTFNRGSFQSFEGLNLRIVKKERSHEFYNSKYLYSARNAILSNASADTPFDIQSHYSNVTDGLSADFSDSDNINGNNINSTEGRDEELINSVPHCRGIQLDEDYGSVKEDLTAKISSSKTANDREMESDPDERDTRC
ncbi:unnamed protein product [Leptidea sinapis]|uniref:adenylate cyclase n=1 Tax=Leptidea sinapis TaxID=189913 RepID=A0A5E4QB64_9NEOP|nr:unnamed protein product [Leptidea sinapis]